MPLTLLVLRTMRLILAAVQTGPYYTSRVEKVGIANLNQYIIAGTACRSMSRPFSMSAANPPDASAAPAVAKPSSSVILISPRNEVLLLQRLRTSSSFKSAHVFPGGAVEAKHDGPLPASDSLDFHLDSRAYRLAAIRETFEESGILLARDEMSRKLLRLDNETQEAARKRVHDGEVVFTDWLTQVGGFADTDDLLPFSRWITPPIEKRRFTTQMYIYFLPIDSSIRTLDPTSTTTPPPSDSSNATDSTYLIPTSDGGIEHVSATFRPARDWLKLSQSNDIILFPPQFLLLYFVARYLNPDDDGLGVTQGFLPPDVLEKRRGELRRFVGAGPKPWADKCISPKFKGRRKTTEDGIPKIIVELDWPGYEVERHGRSGQRLLEGDSEYVFLMSWEKNGPRCTDVGKRADLIRDGEKL